MCRSLISTFVNIFRCSEDAFVCAGLSSLMAAGISFHFSVAWLQNVYDAVTKEAKRKKTHFQMFCCMA